MELPDLIAQLKEREARQQQALERTRAAITALVELDAEAIRPGPVARRGNPSVPDCVVRALADGPLSVQALCARSGVSRRELKALVRRGSLLGVGVTRSRRISLPGVPAKEAL